MADVFPELSNSVSPPAEPGVFLEEIRDRGRGGRDEAELPIELINQSTNQRVNQLLVFFADPIGNLADVVHDFLHIQG
jgi:hypothetical protein